MSYSGNQSGTPMLLRIASMSHPSPVKHERQTTLPVLRQLLHAIGIPPIASYPPNPSQVGHWTARESSQLEHPKERRQRRCIAVGKNAGGAGGRDDGGGCVINGLHSRTAMVATRTSVATIPTPSALRSVQSRVLVTLVRLQHGAPSYLLIPPAHSSVTGFHLTYLLTPDEHTCN